MLLSFNALNTQVNLYSLKNSPNTGWVYMGGTACMTPVFLTLSD